jgi:hypothetical protein
MVANAATKRLNNQDCKTEVRHRPCLQLHIGLLLLLLLLLLSMHMVRR